MRLTIKARKILWDLRANLEEQDRLNKLVLRFRHLDKPQCVQVVVDQLVDVVSKQGVLVSQLKREGFDEDVLKALILQEV